jgi:hypothetical protein
MKSSTQIVSTGVKALRLASLVLALALSPGGGGHFPNEHPSGPLSAATGDTQSKSVASAVVVGGPAIESNRVVTRQALSFDGDRNLDVAIAADDIRSAYTRYTIRLRVASGAEQYVAVTGPPGGLQPEILDMTGDNVRNDLVLAPTLLQWPLTVLVNDGHDHFVVAVSALPPDSLGSKEAQASREEIQSNVALRSSGFKISGLPNGRGMFLRQPQRDMQRPFAIAAARLSDHPSISGRAPPTLKA